MIDKANKLLIRILVEKQNLATKLVVTLDYNITQYLFIGGEFVIIELHILLISSILAKFLEN